MCTAIFSAPLCSCRHDTTINKVPDSEIHEASETSQADSETNQLDEDNNFKEDSTYYTGTFNEEVFEHIIQNIKLEGIKISMPCTLKDMGNGFEVSNPLVFEEKALTTYALNYKDVYLGQILYYSDHELTDEELENEEFAQLYINPSELYWGNLSVAGMEIDSDYKALERVLGQPTSKNYDGERKFFIYKLSEKKYIEFHFIDDSIYSIYINVK